MGTCVHVVFFLYELLFMSTFVRVILDSCWSLYAFIRMNSCPCRPLFVWSLSMCAFVLLTFVLWALFYELLSQKRFTYLCQMDMRYSGNYRKIYPKIWYDDIVHQEYILQQVPVVGFAFQNRCQQLNPYRKLNRKQFLTFQYPARMNKLTKNASI